MSLIEHPEWILRRIETLRVIDLDRLERSITLDIDCQQLVARARQAGVSGIGSLPVPIAILTKNLLLDMDVEDADGRPLHVVTSDQDSHAAHSLLMSCLEAKNIDLGHSSTAIVQKLFDIVRESPSPADRNVLLALPGAGDEVQGWGLPKNLLMSSSDVRQWNSFFQVPDFALHIAQFTLNFMAIINVDTSQTTAIVKWRIVETEVGSRANSVREKLCLTPFKFNALAPAVGHAQREHLRIVAPSGIILTKLDFGRLADLARADSALGPEVSSISFATRLTLDRAVVYTGSAPQGNYRAVVEMRPSLAAFVRPALVSVAASAAVLGAGAYAQWRTHVLSRPDRSVEAAVAILLIFPSIVSAYFTREGEHPLVSRLLYYPRIAVGISALLTLVPGGAMVLNLRNGGLALMWALCSLSCLIVVGLLGVIATHVVIERKKVRLSASQTKQEDRIPLVRVFPSQ